MGSNEDLRELEQRGAVLRGHFRLSSGRHGDTFVEKFRILQWPDLTEKLVATVTSPLRGKVSVVAGPTTGGVILSYEAARQLGVRSIIAEKADSGAGREFKRGFELGPGDQVLVIDDVLTTGGSIREVIDAVNACGATVAAVAVLVDRTNGKTSFGVPFSAAITIEVSSWESHGCPLCAQGRPLIVT